MVDILVSAFYADPAWSWAFPDPARRAQQHRLLWTAMVEGALRYPWVWLAPGQTAMPAYLEPSNPANVPLYARYGFEVLGSFSLPGGGPGVVTMWRQPARPGGSGEGERSSDPSRS